MKFGIKSGFKNQKEKGLDIYKPYKNYKMDMNEWTNLWVCQKTNEIILIEDERIFCLSGVLMK